MSHELRTPLNSIIGFTGIVKAGMAGPLNGEQKRQLEMAYASAKHLLGLINDLLDLSRIESGRVEVDWEWFRPADVLQEVEHTLQPMFTAKGLRFVRACPSPELAIRSDRKRFFQIVLNLANNAVKFTDHGEVRVTGGLENDRYMITVADTGIGIKPEHMSMLFEAFRQVDGSARRVYEGTGLGLYLCRRILGLLGGGIRAESDYGQGSCFTFWVPAGALPASDHEPTHPDH
jgi:signal transduction histidine kinase